MAKVKKANKGGARKGAGRKPVEDPKVMVPLYIETSVINELGGFEEVRALCYDYLKLKLKSK